MPDVSPIPPSRSPAHPDKPNSHPLKRMGESLLELYHKWIVGPSPRQVPREHSKRLHGEEHEEAIEREFAKLKQMAGQVHAVLVDKHAIVRLTSRIKKISSDIKKGSSGQRREFDQWIKQIKPMVRLLADQTLEQTVVDHTLDVVQSQIEQDVKIAKNDLAQAIERLQLAKSLKKQHIQDRAQQAIAELLKVLEDWNALKTPPGELNWDNLDQWEDQVASLRATYNHQATSIMDKIDELAAGTFMTKGNEARMSIGELRKITAFELEVSELLLEIDRDMENRQVYEQRLDMLWAKWHQFQQNLEMPPDAYARLQETKIQLDKASDRLI